MNDQVKIEWRIIPDFPRYEISNMGDVRRIVDGFRPKRVKARDGYSYQLQGDEKYYGRTLNVLMRQTFPELMRGV